MTRPPGNGFSIFLERLGFQLVENQSDRLVHCVPVNQNQQVEIEFLHIAAGQNFKTKIFEEHRRAWNSHKEASFVVVSDEETFVINPRVKPDELARSKAEIERFDCGTNTEIDQRTREWLSVDQINAGYFFDYVRQKTKSNREQEVDEDLLLNLIALRLDLSSGGMAEGVADLLILRCLFLKYLEDRGIYPLGYLSSILETGRPKELLRAFEAVGRINGDIFKNEPVSESDFSDSQMQCLARFFNSDYRTGQGRLFPYQFQFIPIQLISHVYEAFLSSAKKQGKGIYYTPQFIVRFILEETLPPVLAKDRNVTILDPACGSGAFLVESFRKIVQAEHAEKDFEAKKQILVNQVFGIDNDAHALQIATFSLYLALLEGLDVAFIRRQIENHAPILPSLLGKNLLHGNSLTDSHLFEGRVFGCIVGNPPWGSVKGDGDPENEKERQAIGGKEKAGTIPDYRFVSDYQRSQAFLLRVSKWVSTESVVGLIVNNSIFLNEHALPFRQHFLEKYRLHRFYELSHLSPILFKKRSIGTVNGEPIEIGANEPAAFLLFSTAPSVDNQVRYVSPLLTGLSEHLKLVHFTQRDVKTVRQKEFLEEDSIWKILVNGDLDDCRLIRQRIVEKNPDLSIECRSGFMPKKDMTLTGEPDYRPLIKAGDIDSYFVNSTSRKFNWNQTLLRRRVESIFQGERLLIDNCPSGANQFRLGFARVQKDEVFQDDVLSVKIRRNNHPVENHLPFLGILNSSLIGYLAYLTATQWGKGKPTRSTLRNSDLEKLPLPYFEENNQLVMRLIEAVRTMERRKQDPFDHQTVELQRQIDELVFELYGLLDFEKETVREFYDIHVHRKGEQATQQDLMAYTTKFKLVFELLLAEHLELACEYKVSKQFGAFVCFKIRERGSDDPPIKLSGIEDVAVFHAVKKAQLVESFSSNRLNEMPTRVYAPEQFFLIKSHFFKDWTVRQAIEDANEEARIMIEETQMAA